MREADKRERGMIFQYDELKEYVREDFERFYQMGFQEEELFPAVLDEYQHGEAFSSTENICIHLFLAQNHAEKGLHAGMIVENLKQLLTEETDCEVRAALGNAYEIYLADLKTKEIFCV